MTSRAPAITSKLRPVWAFLLIAFSTLLLSACDDGDGTAGTNSLSAQNDSLDVNSLLGLGNLDVLANDSFGAGARIVSLTSPSNGGIASINADQTSIDYIPLFGTTGTEQFNYVLTDNSGATSTATVTANLLNSVPLNVPPVALPDTYTILTDSSANQLDVLANDLDANSDPLTITSVSVVLSVPPTSGEILVIDSLNGVLTYTPPAGFIGLQTINYVVEDGQGGSAMGIAAVTVSPLPVPPVAIPDVYNLQSNSPATLFDILDNDIDLTGSGLILQTVSLQTSLPSSSGSTVSVSNNQLLYTPGTDYLGIEVISYEVANGNGQTATGLATLITSPITAPPVALPDLAIVLPDSSGNLIDALANDVDLSGTGLTIDSVTSVLTVPATAGGTVSTDGSTISYSPGVGFVGIETLTYNITDGNGNSSTGAITITVIGIPAALPPVAILDISTVQSGSSNNSIDALSNDIDPAGNGLTISSVSSVATVPLGATSVVSTDGSTISYTPGIGFIGVETLSYTATDSNGATSTAAITVVVAGLPGNLPPVAVPDVATVAANSGASALTALSNDIDTTSTGLSITATSLGSTLPPGTPGSVSTDGATVSYTPATGFTGVETINYTITDGNGSTSSTIISVVVSPLPLPPVAVPDLAIVLSDSSNTSIDVLNNDADISSTGLTITSAANLSSLPIGSTGTVTHNGSNLSYTPEAGFVGVEVLSYEITDGNGNTSSSIVTITVSPLAAPPVAFPDLAIVNQDSSNNSLTVLDNDVDIAAGGLTVTGVTNLETIPTGSTGTVATDGTTVTYTPLAGFSGIELVQYEISDNNGSTATGLITITVTPTSIALDPITLPDAAIVSEDSSNNLITVITNDIDPAAGGLTLTAASVSVDLPIDGAHTVALNGNQIDFTPTAGYAGLVTLQYTVEDVNGATANGTVLVTVTAVGLAAGPITFPDLAIVSEDSSNNLITVISNDIDPAAGGLTLTATSVSVDLPIDGAHTVALNGNQIDFTPTAGYAGLVTLQYTVEDVNGDTANGTVLVTVTATALSAGPIPFPDLAIVSEDSSNNLITVITNDIDPAAGGLTLTAASVSVDLPIDGAHTVALNGNQIDFTPTAGYAGLVTLQYTVEDINGATANGTVLVTVTATALTPGPITFPDLATVNEDSSNNLITVISNDIDPTAGGLTLIAASVSVDLPIDGAHTVAMSGNQIDFTPTAGYVGLVTLEYTIEDINGNTATGNVLVTVTALPIVLPPLAVSDLGSMTPNSTSSFDVAANDIDPAGGGLTITNASIVLELPSSAGANSVAIVSNQLEVTTGLVYVGLVTISYEVTDSNGNTSTSTIVVTVI